MGYRAHEGGPKFRVSEIDLDRVNIVLKRTVDLTAKNYRSVVKVSLGPHVDGFSYPHVDPTDCWTMCHGMYKRMGRTLPTIDNTTINAICGKNRTDFSGVHDIFRHHAIRGRLNLLRDLKKTSQYYCERFLTPISPEYDLDFELWLSETNYDNKRKQELRDAHEHLTLIEQSLSPRKWKKFLVKLFIKDESYAEMKAARMIYARDDYAKVFFGPLIKAIEKHVYDCPDLHGSTPFIKHIPVSERAEYITNRLERAGMRYVVSDYSSFECHFSKSKMKSTTFPMYKYMFQGHAEGLSKIKIFLQMVSGTNHCSTKFFNATVAASRMSGEMDTSLANGWSNLMWMTYANMIWGTWEDNICVVEGDDNTSSCTDPPPAQLYTAMGCLVKQEFYDELCYASFCGLLFDVASRQVITDFFKFFGNVAWTTNQYACASDKTLRMLLRAKCMSYIVAYPACPVITSFCWNMLRLTAGYDLRKLLNKKGYFSNQWEKQKLRTAMDSFSSKFKPHTISPGTRLLFEEMYGITNAQQLYLERMFDSMTGIEPLNLLTVIDFPRDGVDYWNRFTIRYNKNTMESIPEYFVDP